MKLISVVYVIPWSALITQKQVSVFQSLYKFMFLEMKILFQGKMNNNINCLKIVNNTKKSVGFFMNGRNTQRLDDLMPLIALLFCMDLLWINTVSAFYCYLPISWGVTTLINQKSTLVCKSTLITPPSLPGTANIHVFSSLITDRNYVHQSSIYGCMYNNTISRSSNMFSNHNW